MEGFTIHAYSGEHLHELVSLIERDLSEPYSIFTYHYFLHEQPHLCRTVWATYIRRFHHVGLEGWEDGGGGNW